MTKTSTAAVVEVTRWGRVARSLSVLGSSLAWLVISLNALSLLANWSGVVRLLRDKDSVSSLATARSTALETVLGLRGIAHACLEDSLSESALPAVQAPDDRAKLAYSERYHVEVDFSQVKSTIFTRESKLPQRLTRAGLGSCIEERAFGAEKLLSRDLLESRVLWAYILFETADYSNFVLWPSASAPASFRPWDRPWYPEKASRSSRKHSLDDQTVLFESNPFSDAFTREQIISLSITDPVGGGRLTTVVDSQAGSASANYARLILLNTIISAAIVVLSLLVARGLPADYTKSWYRAWLGVALLYSMVSLWHFGTPGNVLGLPAAWQSILVSLLSIVNSAFFLLSARTLQKPLAFHRARVIALRFGFAACVLFLLGEIVQRRLRLDFPLGEVIEAAFTAVALGAFSLCVVRVLRECAATLPSSIWPRTRNRDRLPSWHHIGAAMVVVFMGVYILLQASIPFWRQNPALEDLFLFASVPMKVGFASIFFAVVLIELYWEKFQGSDLFFETSRQAVLIVDADYRITAANRAAVSIVGLPIETMRGSHLNQVLFRSLREAEETYRDLVNDNRISGRAVRGKKFAGIPTLLTEVEYLVSAALIGRGVEGRARAVFVVSERAA